MTTEHVHDHHEDPAPCPVCGSYSGSTLGQQSSALLAVCDVLVVQALASVGKRIVREERSRFARLGNRPWHVAHTQWTPIARDIDRGMAQAWDVVPAFLDVHGCCGVTSRQVTEMLDSYVRDLLLTGTAHHLSQLRYRLETRLGITLPEPLVPATVRAEAWR